MPDLSDKVSDRDGIPQDVWDASDATADFIATGLAAAILGKATSEDVAVSITKAVSNAIMADRRTCPAPKPDETPAALGGIVISRHLAQDLFSYGCIKPVTGVMYSMTHKEALEQLSAAMAPSTRPAASIKEGWRTMDSAPTGKVVLLWKPATREIYVACRAHGEHGPGWCTPDGFEIFGVEAWQYPPAPPATTPILSTAQQEDSKK